MRQGEIQEDTEIYVSYIVVFLSFSLSQEEPWNETRIFSFLRACTLRVTTVSIIRTMTPVTIHLSLM
jgi:hypothetical protein